MRYRNNKGQFVADKKVEKTRKLFAIGMLAWFSFAIISSLVQSAG